MLPPDKQPVVQYGVPQIQSKPRWLYVLGTICLVVGCLIILVKVSNTMLSSGMTCCQSSFGILMTLPLPLGGFMLVQRKAVARKLLIFWSWFAIAGGTYLIAFYFIRPLLDPASRLGNLSSDEKASWTLEFVINTLLVLFAVFLAIWLSRRFVRKDLQDY